MMKKNLPIDPILSSLCGLLFHYDFFLYKWIMTNNPDYLCSIAGMMDGILSTVENKSKSLENRQYFIDKNYAIEAYLKWVTEDVISYRNGVMF